ncbi:MAG: hypothetical protein IPK32_21700 [Verrucomicrobiaceae bacterium]|nr:hypothetical protein [Verrucomicrobiaceae bacterium]
MPPHAGDALRTCKPHEPVVAYLRSVFRDADADFESGSQVPARGIPAQPGTWSGDFSRGISMPLVEPMDADFLVIEAAVVSKTPQSAQTVSEFPGHYVDQVEARLTGNAHAWAVAHNAK